VTIDPSGHLLDSAIDPDDLELSRVAPEARRRIGV
jgi:hypothetical protein